MRILVVHRRFDHERAEVDFLRSLGAVASLAEWVEPMDYHGFDAVVFMVAFRDLVVAEPIDWGGFSGLRLMLDHDACQNYEAVSERAGYLGAWPGEVRRHRFDGMVVSGRQLADRFRADGIAAHWVPKGYSEERFFDGGDDRTGLVHYGAPYRARRLMLERVARAGFQVEHLQVPYGALPDRLRRAEACLVCNLAGRVPLGRLGRAINRVRPFVQVGPSVEPMLKNFEAAASGCAVFADWHPDLADLGFVDGEHVVAYDGFDELVAKLRWWLDRPDEMRRLGSASAALCRARHTWNHRAAVLANIIDDQLGAR